MVSSVVPKPDNPRAIEPKREKITAINRKTAGIKAESVTKRNWRANNKERYNAYQKELMRKRRG